MKNLIIPLTYTIIKTKETPLFIFNDAILIIFMDGVS